MRHLHAIVLWFLYVSMLIVCGSMQTMARSYSSWSEIPESGPSPGYRTGHAGVADYEGDAALFFAGHNGDYIPTNDLWRFSFHGKSWEQLRVSSAAPPARYDHCGTTCFSGSSSEALFFGGAALNSSLANKTSHVLLNDVWALTLNASGSWYQRSSSTSTVPSPRRNSACACIGASFFVVFGGRDIHGAKSDTWFLNLQSNTWTELPSPSTQAPGPLFASCMHSLSDSRFFVFGGFNSKSIASKQAWVLTLSVSTSNNGTSAVRWEHLNPQPSLQARGFHNCIGPPASVPEQAQTIHIRGGIGAGETRNDNIFEDFQTCKLIVKGDVTNLNCRPVVFVYSVSPICSACIAVMISNIVLVHGGLGKGGDVSGKTSLLYMSDMTVEQLMNHGEPAPVARSGAVIEHYTHINDVRYLFLHGGIDSQNVLLSDTWLLDLSTSRCVTFQASLYCCAL
jgi:hypothetical protein